MNYIEFKIIKNNISIEEWLKTFYVSKQNIYQLKLNNSILVNHQPANWNTLLQINDIITIELSDFENNNYSHYKQNLDVLYEDEDVIVLNKPKNILVHSDGNTEQTLGNMLSFYFYQKGLNRSIRHVHRLDYETSGCIIYAKHFLAHSFLNHQVENQILSRQYSVICHGNVMPREDVISDKIGRNRHKSGLYIVSKKGKEAITNYKVIASKNNFSFLEVELKTGRTHQIRVHLSSRHYPIVGDKVYGRDDSYSMMLHASKLEFVHPRTNRLIQVRASLPEEFLKLRKLI